MGVAWRPVDGWPETFWPGGHGAIRRWLAECSSMCQWPRPPSMEDEMLILTRKTGQDIVIGQVITIKLIEIKGKQVRLGIEAPKDVSIHRGEIQIRIKEERTGQRRRKQA